MLSTFEVSASHRPGLQQGILVHEAICKILRVYVKKVCLLGMVRVDFPEIHQALRAQETAEHLYFAESTD